MSDSKNGPCLSHNARSLKPETKVCSAPYTSTALVEDPPASLGRQQKLQSEPLTCEPSVPFFSLRQLCPNILFMKMLLLGPAHYHNLHGANLIILDEAL